jgi:hypothetical protein
VIVSKNRLIDHLQKLRLGVDGPEHFEQFGMLPRADFHAVRFAVAVETPISGDFGRAIIFQEVNANLRQFARDVRGHFVNVRAEICAPAQEHGNFVFEAVVDVRQRRHGNRIEVPSETVSAE